jgi:hypothetical protein
VKNCKAINSSASQGGVSIFDACMLCMLLIVVGLLTSCQQPGYRDQNGFWRTYPPTYPTNTQNSSRYAPGYLADRSAPDWQTNQCAGQRNQQAQVSPAVVQAPANTSRQATKKTVATMRKRLPQPQSQWVLPPIPQKGYNARWDKRPYDRSPSGLYWVLDSVGNRWSMPPKAVWRFRSECFDKGVSFQMFDPYDPHAR